MRTILITVTRGLIARNILRAGVLDALLVQPDVEVVIGVTRLEPYFAEEFSRPRVRIVLLPRVRAPRLERLLEPFYRNLVFTVNEELVMRYGKELNTPRRGLHVWAAIRFFRFFSRRRLLKLALRRLLAALPSQPAAVEFLRGIAPQLVFATDVQGAYDVAIQRAAKSLGIPVAAMTKGWENAARRFYWQVPDVLFVQNAQVVHDAVVHQLIPATRVREVGFPQFDIYDRAGDALRPRAEHLARLGFAPDRKVIMLGSEGVWSAQDDRIADTLVAWNRAGAFGVACGIVIRPHFSDAGSPRYDRFRGLPDVFVDDRYRLSAMFHDKWDPSREDMDWFLNQMKHLDVMVTFASTLTLDAAQCDKPIVNVAYGAHVGRTGEDLTWTLYRMHHYLNVLPTGGVSLVRSDEELRAAILAALADPARAAAGRQRLRAAYAARCDGASAARLAQALLGMVPDRPLP